VKSRSDGAKISLERSAEVNQNAWNVQPRFFARRSPIKELWRRKQLTPQVLGIYDTLRSRIEWFAAH
jgi:hypothetical protein